MHVTLTPRSGHPKTATWASCRGAVMPSRHHAVIRRGAGRHRRLATHQPPPAQAMLTASWRGPAPSPATPSNIVDFNATMPRKSPIVMISERHRQFAQEYAKTWNAAHAAKVCGYSPRSAKSVGAKISKRADVQAELLRIQSKNGEKPVGDRQEALEICWRHVRSGGRNSRAWLQHIISISGWASETIRQVHSNLPAPLFILPGSPQITEAQQVGALVREDKGQRPTKNIDMLVDPESQDAEPQ